MTTTKKVLIAALVASSLVQASSSSLAGFDFTRLRPVIEQSKKAVAKRSFYVYQKDALKLVKKELKRAYKMAKLNGLSTWFSDRQLYKAYKKFVYKNWKKTGQFPVF